MPLSLPGGQTDRLDRRSWRLTLCRPLRSGEIQILSPRLTFCLRISGVEPRNLHFGYHKLKDLLKKKKQQTYNNCGDREEKRNCSRGRQLIEGTEGRPSRMI